MVSVSRLLICIAVHAFFCDIHGYIPAFTSPYKTFFPTQTPIFSFRSKDFDGTSDSAKNIEDLDMLWDREDDFDDNEAFVASEEGFYTSQVDEPTPSNDFSSMNVVPDDDNFLNSEPEEDYSIREHPIEFWNLRLDLLKKYHAEYDDINVPDNYKVENDNGMTINLGYFLSWLRSQSDAKVLQELIPSEIMLELKNLGLEWEDSQAKKKLFAQRLCEWKDYVRSHQLMHPALRNWVGQQRYQYSRKQKGLPNNLGDDHEKCLLDAGVVPVREERWDGYWNSRLEEWIELKQANALQSMNSTVLLWAWEQWRMFEIICGEISYDGDLPVLLTADRLKRLQDVDFYESERPASMHLESPDAQLSANNLNATVLMDTIRTYLSLNGNLDIKPSCSVLVEGKSLYSICAKLRAKYQRSKLLEDDASKSLLTIDKTFIKELEKLDFFSEKFHQDPMQGTYDWWEYYHDFKSQQRDFFINRAKDQTIGSWIEAQKQRFNLLVGNQDDFIAETQYEALARLGVVFHVSGTLEYSISDGFRGRPKSLRKLNDDILQDKNVFRERQDDVLENMTWNLRYEQMRDFMSKKPNSTDELRTLNPRLAQWADNQRLQFQKSIYGLTKTPLTDERIEMLKSIDFDLGLKYKPGCGERDDWETMLSALRRFKGSHGHCFVPMNLPSCPRLGHWVNQKRKAYKQKKLVKRQVGELEDIGLDLSSTDFNYYRRANDAQWNEYFGELKLFYEENGHFDLHKSRNFSIEADFLVSWAQQQKDLYLLQKDSQSFLYMSRERIKKLDSLGFLSRVSN
mmetsp:Transcript_22825/g.34600  ORF Transcript_22825/g.34600 Transcript_22825/m.34600 type:complete len:796 (-) Transcript_22825:1541-3928(-)